MSEINVQLKEGAAVPMPASSTVAEALKKLDRDLAKQALAAKVDGREVDLTAPLEKIQNGDMSVRIEPIVPQTRDGLEVLRHSTAHLLAAAVLDLFPGTKLGIGPALLDDPRYGFFYDVIAPRPLTDADLPVIEKRMKQIASQNLSYRRDEIPKQEALRIFADREEPLKCELIDEKASAAPPNGTSWSSKLSSRCTGLKSSIPKLRKRARKPSLLLLNRGIRKRPRSSSANTSPLARCMT